MQKQVLFGKEAREKILSGVTQIVKAVSVTMGASGKTVVVGNAAYGDDGLVQSPTIVTKDGYTVCKHFELPDAVENRAALFVREAAEKTVEEAGDSTTATAVLAGSMIEQGIRLIDEQGANSQELKRGIDAAVEEVVEELKKASIKVSGNNEMLHHVASVSANNDTVIGRYISDSYKKIGDEGVIQVTESKGLETTIKIVDGFKWSKGWESQLFVNNPTKQTWEADNAWVLVYDKKITHHSQIEETLKFVLGQPDKRPLLIVCEGAQDEGLAYLAMNNRRKVINVCIVKGSGVGDYRTKFMEDVSLITGGEYVADISGIDIKKIKSHHLGKAKKITVSKDETVITGGDGNLGDIENFLNELKMNLAEAKTEDEKNPIEKRIASLTGKIAIIEVGAATDIELGEKLDRYDDAVRSTKSAIQEGVIIGGGTSFLRISPNVSFRKNNWLQQIFNTTPITTDFEKGKNLVYEAIEKPFKQILENAGLNVEFIYAQVKEETGNVGYNLKTNKLENLVNAGILDSTKAIRCALINAASVSGAALTTECLIVTIA